MQKQRIRSGKRPLYAAVAVLVYAALFGLSSVGSYVMAALVFYLAYGLLKRRFPDRTVELPPRTGDEACDALILEGRAALEQIGAHEAALDDAQLRALAASIGRQGGQILQRLQERPALAGDLRTFLRYYLPTAARLLDACVRLDGGDAAQDVRARAKEALRRVDGALSRQLAALDEYRLLDLQTDMDVLEDMLRRDGYAGQQPAARPPEGGAR